MKIALKKEILDRIKSDPILYGKVAFELEIAPASLPRLIYTNDPKLTQAGILRILMDFLGSSSSEDLLEKVEPESKDIQLI